MTERFSRVEGVIPDHTKDWIELESLKTQTPIKIIVGNAVALYKAHNESSNLGQKREFMQLSVRNVKKNLRDLRENTQEIGKNEPNLIQYTHSLCQILSKMTKRVPKKTRDFTRSLRRSAIADHIQAISIIQASDREIYDDILKIMNESLHKDDIEYFFQLSKCSRGHEGTLYIGNTLDDSSVYSEITVLASNCMTVGMKDRPAKIEWTKEYISNKYNQDDISELISVFMIELETQEAKKGETIL